MGISRDIREKVYLKFGGHCGYCGRKLERSQMEVDHIVPKRFYRYGGDTGPDKFSNLMPACNTCNHYKRALFVEDYKEYMLEFHKRLKRVPKNPRTKKGRRYKEYMERVARAYGITVDKPFSGKFYFENFLTEQKNIER